MKVAIIGGPILSGGKKNLIMEYFRHMDREAVKMDIICNADSNAIPQEEIEALGGRVFIVPSFKNIKGHTMALYKLFKREQYDVVHAYNSMMNLFPMYAAKRAGVKVRISESLSMAAPGEWKTYVKEALRPFSHLYATHFMSCGEDCGVFQFGKKALREGKIAIFKTAINVRANAYDEELRKVTREKMGWTDKVVYGFIGRFEMQKNPVFLIDVMNAIRQKQENAHFAIIGAGDMEQQMKDRMKVHGLSVEEGGEVSWLGRREDIKQFYNAFDAFLLPSLYEGLPVVGLESQSCGLPIFMSTAVTPEASACAMGRFVPLDAGAEGWAEAVVPFTLKNMQERRSYVDEVIKAGFDSTTEALRMQRFYEDAVAECK